MLDSHLTTKSHHTQTYSHDRWHIIIVIAWDLVHARSYCCSNVSFNKCLKQLTGFLAFHRSMLYPI